MKVLALSDSLAPWHSFWIRIGQHLSALPWPADITDNPAAIDTLSAGIARWIGIPCHGCDLDPRAHRDTAFAAQQNDAAELVHLHA